MTPLLKALVPRIIREHAAQGRSAIRHWRAKNRSVVEVFEEIYLLNKWGGKPGEMHSGAGSRGDMARHYINLICRFIEQRGVTSMVDIGCGDFYIAGRILARARWPILYTGFDAAKSVIEANQVRFSSAGILFQWADVSKDGSLPAAGLCLIRQVFQHLSNAQILNILAKLHVFKWTLITEHYPHNDWFKTVNVDMVHGAGTRLLKGSGVYLDRPPFNLKSISLVDEIDVENGDPRQGQLRTWVIESRVDSSDRVPQPRFKMGSSYSRVLG